MNELYKTVGISKQAIAQYAMRQNEFDSNLINLMMEVEELRAEHPGCGLEKMYVTLNPAYIGMEWGSVALERINSMHLHGMGADMTVPCLSMVLMLVALGTAVWLRQVANDRRLINGSAAAGVGGERI